MSQQFEELATKTIGDDVAGPFTANNSQLEPNTKNGRFEGEAKFSENFESYADQTDADANWIPVGTVTRVDFTANVLDWDFDKVGGNRAVSFDLWSQGIFPSDTNWTLRWKMTYVTVGDTSSSANIGNVGLYVEDSSVTSASNQTLISFKFFKGTNTTTTNFIGLQSKLNATTNDSFGDVAFDDQKNEVGIFFFELKRTSDTTYEGSIYSDVDYTTLIEKVKTTCSASIIDLRYIKIHNDDRVAVGGDSFNGTMDDFSFFNDTEGLQNFLTVKSNKIKTSAFDDSFDSYGSDILPNYIDDFSDAAPWTTTDSAKARVEPLQGFLFFSAVADTTNDAIAHDLGTNITIAPDFQDDFSSDTWTQIGTNVAINPPVMDFDNPPNSDFEHQEAKDMLGSTISNSAWTLRWKYSLSTVTQGTSGDANADQDVLFAITDTDETNTVSDTSTFISFRHRVNTTQNVFQIFFAFMADMRGGILPATMTTVPTAGVTYYFEMKRTTTTDATLSVYSDANFQFLIETVNTLTFSSVIQDLRYLKCMSWQGTGVFNQNDGQITGEIDDVEFWDGVTVLDAPISDTEWVLRSEFNLTDIDNGGDNIDKRIFFGIFDQDETADAGVNQDGIFLDMRTDLVPGDRIRMSAVNNADPGTSVQLGTFNDPRLVPLLNQKYFVEIKRISTTDMEVGFYTDNTYSDAIEVIRVATLPAGITNLRYLKMMNEPVTGNGKLDLTFKNLDFWNATNLTRTTIADSYVQQGTDISIDKERSLVVYDAANQNSLEMLTTDVTGATLPSIFTTRFKLVIDQKVQGADATPVMLLIGLSGFDGTQTLNQINSNWIGLRITISSTLNEFRAVGCRSNDFFDNPVTDTETNGGFTTLPDPGTYYFEITRTADIFSYIKIWADKDYTEIIEAIKINHGALGGLLRYFKVGNGDNGDGTEDSTLIGTVDDIRLWENTRDPDGYGAREYYHQSSLVKFASGTMQVGELVSGDNASNPGGSEYKNRFSLNGGADTANDDNEGTMATGMVDSDVFIESFMNQDFKTVNSLALASNTVGLTVPDKMVGIWRYQEFPQLEKLTLINTAGGLYGTGSRSTVWGSIP